MNKQENRKPDQMSRRKLLASMGIAGAAVASGALVPGVGGQVSANPNRDADQNMYRYAPHLPDRTVGERFREYVSVKDFGAKGDGVTDDTNAIRDAIESVASNGGGTLFVPSGRYKVSAIYKSPIHDGYTAINLLSNVHFVMSPNAEIALEANDLDNYGILEAHDVHDVSIRGGKIIGERDAHIGTTGEWGMGISIRGSRDIYVSDVEIVDCWGDGVYIGSTANQNYSQNVIVERVRAIRNRRQGISLISGKDIVIRDGDLEDTGGAAPGDGIDIEPNNGNEFLQNIMIENIRTKNNAGSGIKFFMNHFRNSKNPISVTIKNHYDVDSEYGFRARGYIPNVEGYILIESSRWVNTSRTFYIQDWAASGPRIEVFDPIAVWTGGGGNSAYAITKENNVPDSNILGNVHLHRPMVVVEEGATAPERGIYLSPTSSEAVQNVSIIDPVSLPVSLDHTEINILGSIRDLNLSDRYGILHRSNTGTLAIRSNRHKLTYDNSGAAGTTVFILDTMVGGEMTITNVEGRRLDIRPPTGSGRVIYPLTSSEKTISSTQKGATVTLEVSADGNYIVKNVVGNWEEF